MKLNNLFSLTKHPSENKGAIFIPKNKKMLQMQHIKEREDKTMTKMTKTTLTKVKEMAKVDVTLNEKLMYAAEMRAEVEKEAEKIDKKIKKRNRKKK